MVGGPWGIYAKWNKSNSKGQILYDLNHVWNLRKQNKWRNKTNTNTKTQRTDWWFPEVEGVGKGEMEEKGQRYGNTHIVGTEVELIQCCARETCNVINQCYLKKCKNGSAVRVHVKKPKPEHKWCYPNLPSTHQLKPGLPGGFQGPPPCSEPPRRPLFPWMLWNNGVKELDWHSGTQ